MPKGGRKPIKVRSYLQQFYEARAAKEAGGSGACDGVSSGIKAERLCLLQTANSPQQSKSPQPSAATSSGIGSWRWGPYCEYFPIAILCIGVGLLMLGFGCFAIQQLGSTPQLPVRGRVLSVGLVAAGCLLACAGTAASLMAPSRKSSSAAGMTGTDVETAGKSADED
ncbi:hypothetical protein BOX15_Mlig033220g1 [Macrostomum lignano]|uniref:Uncharacterized protein n=1 Tax=Macrostomum lignano TaxID=282301 RepID=A0A267DC75_9PLAT|nr:hypothetical protein BOX15_Mlig033220g1 [Macrostomum lignano]